MAACPARNGCSLIHLVISMAGILFVCTGNLYRSPLAAAFFRRKLQETGQPGEWVVDSAGTWTAPGQSLPAATIQVAGRFGIDLDNHLTKLITADLLAGADLVLVMEKGHKEALDIEFPLARGKIHLLSAVVDHMAYDIPDPAASMQDLESIALELHKLMDRGCQAICDLVQAGQNSNP